MKGKKFIALAVGAVMCGSLVAGLTGCSKGDPVKVWVSEVEGVKTLTEQQINKFLDANPDYKGKYNITVDGMSEGEAATNMITDVSTGADVYCYAQDQMARLIEAKALSSLGSASAKFVQDNNDADSVRAVTIDKTVYSYPLTSDNGYFMYYDKSVVKAESLGDLGKIVADCEAAGKNICFEIEGSAWYTASFFFGAGCTSTWQFDKTTGKWKAADDFSGEKGMIALKGTQILTGSSKYVSSSDCGEFAKGAAVVVSGTWGAGTAARELGENYAATKLPSYNVGGKDYQLRSFKGFKLMGVKPQANAERTEFCHKLAQYLTDKDCQLERLEKFSWGPSNKVAAASDLVKDNVALKAIAAQNEFAVIQGQIHGGWWDVAKALGATAPKDASGVPQLKDEAALQGMLDTYQAAIDKFEQMTEEAMNAFGVIGSIADLNDNGVAADKLSEGQTAWASWGADYKMTKTENEDGTVVWKSVDKIKLADGDEFQVRQGQAWDTQFGNVEADGYSSKNNFKITAANAGEFYVVLTLNKDGKGVVSLAAE